MKGKNGKPSKWHGYQPGSAKEYDPNDPHFNPMHPPKGYPQDLLEAEWAETETIAVEETLPDGNKRTVYIIQRKEGQD